MAITKRGRPLSKSRQGKIVAIGIESVSKFASSAKEAKNGRMHGEISRKSDGNVDLAAEIKKHPDSLWLRVKAIEADRENDNGDYFSRDEILKSYKTFEGCPVFTNHENQKVEAAKGKVVLAEWDDEDQSVFCTLFVDREACPALCRAIEEGYVTDVSMGTQVDYSICSVCKQKAYEASTYCDHVKTMKGRTIDGKKVYEENYGLKFIEISVVTDGACEDCTIREIIDPEDYEGNLKAAANNIKTIKKGGLYKDGGQAEVDLLNGAMDNIENVLRAMLDQRQFIDLEFMQDLTEVFADLQHVTDELVDQGYGSVGQQQTEIGVPPMPETAEEGEAPAAFEAGPAGSAGTVTRPAKSQKKEVTAKMDQIQNRLKDLRDKTAKIQREITETSRHSGGDQVSQEKNYQKTIEKLAGIWKNPSVKQFTTQVAEGDLKIVVGKEEILGLRGGKKLSSIKVAELDSDIKEMLETNPREIGEHMLDAFKKTASIEKIAEASPVDAKEQVQQTMESQLREQNPPLHPRENEPREAITEKQMQQEWHGYDWHKQGMEQARHQVTEKQLHEIADKKDFPGYDYHKPQGDRDEITEGQLRDEKIKGNITPGKSDREWAAGVSEQKQQITEGQLGDWKKQDENHLPSHLITEKQLGDQEDPLGRRLASITKDNAKEVIARTTKALGNTATSNDLDAETLVEVANSFLSSPRDGMAAIQTMENLGNPSQMRLFKQATKKDAKDCLLASLVEQEMSPDVALAALKTVANKGNLEKIAEAIEEASKAPEKQPSADELLKEAMTDKPKDDKAKPEEVKVIMSVDDIGAKSSDKEAFAKEAFEKATKLASAQGVKVTEQVHVKKAENGKVEVAMMGVKSATSCKECGYVECECDEKEEKKEEDKPKAAKRSEERKKKVEAQFGGGTGGGSPAPGMEAGGPAAGGATMPVGPAGMPEEPGIGAVGEEPMESADSMDDNPESMPPGSICPSCGSDDVDVDSGQFGCNNCGAKGSIEVNLKMTNWPDTIQEKGPGETSGGEEGIDEGIGEMEGGPGMELPEVGIAATFKITPEMVKTAGEKPVGSWCPHCGSGSVSISKKAGKCSFCNGTYRIDTYWDKSDNALVGRIAWRDRMVKRLVAKQKKEAILAKRRGRITAIKLDKKRETLAIALKARRLETKFAKGDLKTKAEIIANLADEGLIEKN